MVVVVATAVVVFYANREVSGGFFPSFLWYPTRGMEGTDGGERQGGRTADEGENEKKSVLYSLRIRKGKRAPPSWKKKKEVETERRERERKEEEEGRGGERTRERKSNRIAVRSFQLAWHDEGGLVARLLVRSMSSLSFSLSPSSPILLSLFYSSASPSYHLLALFLPLSLAPSRFPALFHRSTPPAALPCCIAHTRHGCLRNPSVILRTPVRGQDYPASCAIARK